MIEGELYLVFLFVKQDTGNGTEPVGTLLGVLLHKESVAYQSTEKMNNMSYSFFDIHKIM